MSQPFRLKKTIRDLKVSVDKIIQSYPKRWTVGVAVKNLETNSGIEIKGDEVFPSASTFKVAVLYELFREADEKKVNLRRRIAIKEKYLSPGSGIINFLDSGLKLSLRDLAVFMIVLSDNTATDIVMDTVGKENVDRLLRNLGLVKTSFPKNTKELLGDAFGIDVMAVQGRKLLELCRKKGERGEYNPKTIVFSETRDNDITTPKEMGQLLENLSKGFMLTEESKEEAMKILLEQQLNTRIPLLLPPNVEVAHKTGTLMGNINGKMTGIVNDAGIICMGNDKKVILSAFTKDVDDRSKATLLIAKIAKAVHDYFAN